MDRQISRVLVGAVQGRSGKTTVTLGLLRALRDRGLAVQAFKKGPDYIDASWMTFASGRPCRNLDLFMMGEKGVREVFLAGSRDADIRVVEGSMGLFDGLDVDGSCSSAEVAALLRTPVLLVVNCTRLTRSAAALVNGVVGFDPRVRIGGVILNQVARERHASILTQSIERYCDVPVLGLLPKSERVAIPDRHLGLIPAGEQDALRERVASLGELARENIDLDRLLEIAGSAEPFAPESEQPPAEESVRCACRAGAETRAGGRRGAAAAENAAREAAARMERVRIGVFRDRAFSFYYPENLEALEAAGAELVPVDSMQDPRLPALDALYIGGGFPEVMAEEIGRNRSLMRQVRERIEDGLPVYAECGGLMYLSRAIRLDDGRRYAMAGVFPCEVQMEKKPQGLGYTVQRVLPGNPFFAEGTLVRGHEFHHSRLLDAEDLTYGFATLRGKGVGGGFDGLMYQNTLAAYHHLHVSAAPEWAERMVALAGAYRRSRANPFGGTV